MTIKPDKKQQKEKSDSSSSDHNQHSGHSSARTSGEGRSVSSRTNPRHTNSPTPLWGSLASRDDPRLGASHDPGGRFDDFSHESHSSHNKRRHRSSPHRNVRRYRGYDASYSSGYDASYPSTSSHSQAHVHRLSSYHLEPPSTSQDLTPRPDLNSEPVPVEDLAASNSGDEYVARGPDPENIEQLEHWFRHVLKEKRGFVIKEMSDDGACLFRAVADQVYGDQEMHDLVRQNCMDYMSKNADFFRQYVTEDFDMYLNRKRLHSSHGNHVEIQAMSELYNRPLEVYQYNFEPINTFHGAYKTDDEPIRLSYHGGVHYNSIVDPSKATIGVGLGLPGFQPGIAEKNLMKDAVQASEHVAIETTMLQDKLRETDWEVTQESIEEQVARESYLQWLRDQEKLGKNPSSSAKSASATCSTAGASQALCGASSPKSSEDTLSSRSPRSLSRNCSGQNSPARLCDGFAETMSSSDTAQIHQLMLPKSPVPCSTRGESVHHSPRLEGAIGGLSETVSMMNDIDPHMYGFSEWGEEDILAQVIAQSQQEYLDTLRNKAYRDKSDSSSCSSDGGGSPCDAYRAELDPHNRPSQTKNSHSNTKGGLSKKC